MKQNKMLIRNKKIVPCLLATALIGNSVFNQSLVAYAANDNSKKEEIVYAILDSSGAVNGIHVVNSFTDNNIVDYGNYTNIKNLTTTDKIYTNGDRITFWTKADKVYYQGDLETKEIPWNIVIRYFLDDTEYTAEEIAGKSGQLKITISITENTTCDSSFWDGYALQASLSLDTNKCTSIHAEHATIANVGSNKQLSYIVMPGKGADYTITASVKNFEMDAISINGMKLNLNFDLDNDELTDKVEQIQDAITQLNDGSIELDDGANQLGDGTKDLYDGTVSLMNGTNALTNGVTSLNEGIETVQTALTTLDNKSENLTTGSAKVLKALKTIQSSLKKIDMDSQNISSLSSASTEIKQGIDSLVNGLETMVQNINSYYLGLSASGITDINDYVSKHNQAITALSISATQRTLYQAYKVSGNAGVLETLSNLVQNKNEEATKLYQTYVASGNDSSVISEYISTAGKLISTESLLKGDIAYIQGSNQLISGIQSTLDSQNGALMQGALSLQSNYKTFDKNIQDLTKSLLSLSTNMKTLKKGINSLVTNYKKIDTGIVEYTTAVNKITDGYKDIYKGALSVSKGTTQLYDGTKDLVDGALDLYDGSKDLVSGTTELSNGTNKLFNKTQDMDTEISDKIDETINDLTGKNIETISFVSEKNTNVDSVLFIIKTPAIELPEEKEPETNEEAPLSLGQKFLKLFGVEK